MGQSLLQNELFQRGKVTIIETSGLAKAAAL
jgi:hypothetical protein